MKAIWNNQVIAESEKTVFIEGNHYFPTDTVKKEYLIESATESNCAWKGIASYHTLSVDGKENKDAMWHYKDPKQMAIAIKDHVAFWRGVEVTE